MLRCIIVDDEPPACDELKYLLEEIGLVEVVGIVYNGTDAVQASRNLEPDCIFLDIQMPELSGLQVAEFLLEQDYVPIVVFVTAYDEYAIRAFELNAIDYILKPISSQRLKKTLIRVQNRTGIRTGGYELRLLNVLERFVVDSQRSCTRIGVRHHSRLIPLGQEEIVYATTDKKDTVIVSTKGEFPSHHTLGQLEERLSSIAFFRSHRSFLVNLNHIKEIQPWFNSTYQLKMTGREETVPVSRSRVRDFRRIMNID